jgi:thiol-disulfide isomerase/thioredoxin
MKKLLLGLSLALAVISRANAALIDFINGVKVGTSMPESDLQYLSTTPELAGQVVLVDFWATWCE